MPWIKNHVGMVAFLLSAATFAALEVGSRHSPPTPTRVPVVATLVPAGARIASQDIRWVNETSLQTVRADALTGYARVTLFPGAVLSPVDIAHESEGVAVVAVTPTNASDVAVVPVSDYVNVLVYTTRGLAWRSGPVLVVARDGGSASIDVAMTMSQALRFEAMKSRGTVAIIGMSS